MSTQEDKTIKYYDEHAEEWAASHSGLNEKSFWNIEMERFHKLLPQGKLIEIGSGTGRDAADLIEMGYDYVGTDASDGFLKLARDRNPKSNFKKVRVQKLAENFSENEFDGFWTAATLLHIPKGEAGESLENIYTIVKNGGVGFISIKEGEGEIEDETSRLFSFYSQDEFSELLKRHNFEILEKSLRVDSKRTTWLIFLVRVNKQVN